MRLRSTFLFAATLAGLVVLDSHGSAAGQSAGPAAAINSKYIERIGTLDAAAVHTAARKHLVPERMLVVAVGDRQKIEADLMKLNLGAIEVRDTAGNIVKP